MTDPNGTAHKALLAHNDAWLAQPGRVCGGGITQPNGVTCHEDGTWSLRGYLHDYCPIHARERLTARREAARYTGGKARR